jgi:nucleotide-binding universal stress UspA family protein
MTTKLDYRRILVATDFSPAAQAALHQAVWVARNSGARITLVHVLPDLRRGMHSASIDAKLDLLYGEGAGFFRELQGDADLRLQQSIEGVAAVDVDIRPKILLGEPIVEICRAAQQLESDLVMAGTLGAGGWQSLFIGSTARRLIRKCPAPVGGQAATFREAEVDSGDHGLFGSEPRRGTSRHCAGKRSRSEVARAARDRQQRRS